MRILVRPDAQVERPLTKMRNGRASLTIFARKRAVKEVIRSNPLTRQTMLWQYSSMLGEPKTNSPSPA
jgi:hypothetical protein